MQQSTNLALGIEPYHASLHRFPLGHPVSTCNPFKQAQEKISNCYDLTLVEAPNLLQTNF